LFRHFGGKDMMAVKPPSVLLAGGGGEKEKREYLSPARKVTFRRGTISTLYSYWKERKGDPSSSWGGSWVREIGKGGGKGAYSGKKEGGERGQPCPKRRTAEIIMLDGRRGRKRVGSIKNKFKEREGRERTEVGEKTTLCRVKRRESEKSKRNERLPRRRIEGRKEKRVQLHYRSVRCRRGKMLEERGPVAPGSK